MSFRNNDNRPILKIGVFMWYNEAIKDYAELNYNINKIYCEKHHYSLIKSNERLCTTRKPHWERIPLMLKHFDEFDYLVWIDADAYFYIDSPPIENVINSYPDKLFIFSGDTDNNSNIKLTCQINSGFFIVKQSQKSRDILNTWFTDDVLFKSPKLSEPIFGANKWNDQAVLRIMYSENILDILDNSIILDYGVLQHFDKNYKVKEKKYNLIDKPFVFHCTNGNNLLFENRVKSSKEYLLKIRLSEFEKYINSNIQLSEKVIFDIILNSTGKKMLVFGLGYDSELWYNLTNKNTFFIENNKKYIDLNKNISDDNICFYSYDGINVPNSLKLTNTQIDSFTIPQKILENAPYDIILVDGPPGYDNSCPGRLLPIYWSKKYLSKKGTIIYVDDVTRNLEKKSVNKYFTENLKTFFSDRLGTIKIIV